METPEQKYEALVNALQYTIGERDRMIALWVLVTRLIDQGSKASDIAKIMQTLQESPSERHQDVFAFLLTGCKYQGFFVEFGACDGRVSSNTYMLEQRFGWTGILAEPAAVWLDSLRENRTARIDTRCVSARSGDSLQFIEAKSPRVSSLYADHPYLGEAAKTYAVETVTLMDLLADHDAPDYIDFLSVDCEGHEYEALRNFDFNRYRFGFICVEQHESLAHDNDVLSLLTAGGYEQIYPRHPDKTKPPHMQISGIDVFFVPKGIFPHLTEVPTGG